MPKEQEQGEKHTQKDLSLEAAIDYRVCLRAVVAAAGVETILWRLDVLVIL
jgi:hypothetical protein